MWGNKKLQKQINELTKRVKELEEKKMTLKKAGNFLIERHINHFAPWETYELTYPETEYYGRDIGTWKITVRKVGE